MMKGCNRCGGCCRDIAVGFTIERVRDNPDFPDREFILKHWKQKEAPKKKLYPNMSGKQYKGYVWMSCDWFNAKTNQCKYYENRPDICRLSECPRQ